MLVLELLLELSSLTPIPKELKYGMEQDGEILEKITLMPLVER
jgi:hypothetical protein